MDCRIRAIARQAGCLLLGVFFLPLSAAGSLDGWQVGDWRKLSDLLSGKKKTVQVVRKHYNQGDIIIYQGFVFYQNLVESQPVPHWIVSHLPDEAEDQPLVFVPDYQGTGGAPSGMHLSSAQLDDHGHPSSSHLAADSEAHEGGVTGDSVAIGEKGGAITDFQPGELEAHFNDLNTGQPRTSTINRPLSSPQERRKPRNLRVGDQGKPHSRVSYLLDSKPLHWYLISLLRENGYTAIYGDFIFFPPGEEFRGAQPDVWLPDHNYTEDIWVLVKFNNGGCDWVSLTDSIPGAGDSNRESGVSTSLKYVSGKKTVSATVLLSGLIKRLLGNGFIVVDGETMLFPVEASNSQQIATLYHQLYEQFLLNLHVAGMNPGHYLWAATPTTVTEAQAFLTANIQTMFIPLFTFLPPAASLTEFASASDSPLKSGDSAQNSNSSNGVSNLPYTVPVISPIVIGLSENSTSESDVDESDPVVTEPIPQEKKQEQKDLNGNAMEGMVATSELAGSLENGQIPLVTGPSHGVSACSCGSGTSDQDEWKTVVKSKAGRKKGAENRKKRPVKPFRKKNSAVKPKPLSEGSENTKAEIAHNSKAKLASKPLQSGKNAEKQSESVYSYRSSSKPTKRVPRTLGKSRVAIKASLTVEVNRRFYETLLEPWRYYAGGGLAVLVATYIYQSMNPGSQTDDREGTLNGKDIVEAGGFEKDVPEDKADGQPLMDIEPIDRDERMPKNCLMELSNNFVGPGMKEWVYDLFERDPIVSYPLIFRLQNNAEDFFAAHEFQSVIASYKKKDYKNKYKRLTYLPFGNKVEKLSALSCDTKQQLLQEIKPWIVKIHNQTSIPAGEAFNWLMLFCGLPVQEVASLNCYRSASELMKDTEWLNREENRQIYSHYTQKAFFHTEYRWLSLPAWEINGRTSLASRPLGIPAVTSGNRLDYLTPVSTTKKMAEIPVPPDASKVEIFTGDLRWYEKEFELIKQLDNYKNLAFRFGLPRGKYQYLILYNRKSIPEASGRDGKDAHVYHIAQRECLGLASTRIIDLCLELLAVDPKIALMLSDLANIKPVVQFPRYELLAVNQELQEVYLDRDQQHTGRHLKRLKKREEAVLAMTSTRLISLEELTRDEFQLIINSYQKAYPVSFGIPSSHFLKRISLCGVVGNRTLSELCYRTRGPLLDLREGKPGYFASRFREYGLPDFFPGLADDPEDYVDYLPTLVFFMNRGALDLLLWPMAQLIRRGIRDRFLVSAEQQGTSTQVSSDRKLEAPVENVRFLAIKGGRLKLIEEPVNTHDAAGSTSLQTGYQTGLFLFGAEGEGAVPHQGVNYLDGQTLKPIPGSIRMQSLLSGNR